MMEIDGIVLFCLISALLSLVLRQYKPEFSMMISLICGVAVILYLLDGIGEIREQLERILSATLLSSELLGVVFKGLGICILSEFASQCCKDAGENAIAVKVELAGKVALTLVSMPLFYRLLEIVGTLLSL